MTDMNEPKQKMNLKDSVIKTIDNDNVCPRSRWFFVCKDTLVWIFWMLSVLVGALSVAVSIFVITQQNFALYEATHENFWTAMMEALPYIWIVLFGITAYLAANNLKHTKRGYRFTVWQVVLSSLILSLAGGAVLQLFGFGYVVDSKLGKEMPMYMSQEKFERELWQSPDDGRLIGRQVLSTTAPTSTVVFEDSKGSRWNLNVSELSNMDLALLESRQVVRIVGTSSNISTKQFHACGAFPWMLDKMRKIKEMSAERDAFIERVYGHKDLAKQRLAAIELETFETDDERLIQLMGTCAKIAPVRRLEAKMK